MNSVALQIKELVDLKQTLIFYGLEFNRQGYVKCPFHVEKTASLSVKNNYFKCFGCGKSGGVIDFVMLYFNLNFSQALIRINRDFNLGLVGKEPTYREKKQFKQTLHNREQEEKNRELLKAGYLETCSKYQYLYRVRREYAPTDPDQPAADWHPVFVYAAQNLERIEQWLDDNIERMEV